MQLPRQSESDVLTGVVDWLSATWREGTPVGRVLEETGLDGQEWEALDRGTQHYRRGLKCGSVRLWYDGRTGSEGVLLEAKGQGCRELDTQGFDWYGFMRQRVLDLLPGRGGSKLTRCDVFADDRDGVLDLEVLGRKARAREFVSAAGARKVRDLWESASTGSQPGQTVYVGSGESERSVRFYDKAVEQGVGGHWVRAELQTRHAGAQVLGWDLVEAVEEGRDPIGVVAGHLRAVVDWREPGSDQRVGRWEVSPWWERFLGNAARAAGTGTRRRTGLEQAEDWLTRQVAPKLALVHEWKRRLYGDEAAVDWLVDLLALGMERLSDQDARLLPAASWPTYTPPPSVMPGAEEQAARVERHRAEGRRLRGATGAK